jgi:hypothetical protein
MHGGLTRVVIQPYSGQSRAPYWNGLVLDWRGLVPEVFPVMAHEVGKGFVASFQEFFLRERQRIQECLISHLVEPHNHAWSTRWHR